MKFLVNNPYIWYPYTLLDVATFLTGFLDRDSPYILEILRSMHYYKETNYNKQAGVVLTFRSVHKVESGAKAQSGVDQVSTLYGGNSRRLCLCSHKHQAISFLQ